MQIKPLLLYLVFKLLLLNSINAQTIHTDKVDLGLYPEFSWDKLPLYMHVRKDKAFTVEELKYLAKFPLITLEKTTGAKQYGNTEQGSLEAAKLIKYYNPDTKIIYYKNVVINWGTYKEDKAFLRQNPEALLRDKKGELIFMKNGKTPFFDISQDYVREYWLQHVQKRVIDSPFDGLFMDANIKVLSNFFKSETGTVKLNSIQEGYYDMMYKLNEELSEQKLLIANIIRVRPEPIFKEDAGLSLLKYFHGSYLEGFDSQGFGLSSQEYLAKGIEATQKAARNGKIIAMTLGLGKAINTHNNTGIDDQREKLGIDENLKKRIDYLIGVFLICAEKYSYLYLHDGYSADYDKKANQYESLVWLKTFPQYLKPLGKPKGYAKREGYIYTRSFEYLDVWVDIKNQKAHLDWK